MTVVPSKEQIEVLREVFVEWLRMHNIDYDFELYTQEEWTEREGADHFLKGSELVITFENDLLTYLNYPGENDVTGELQDLAGGFGYWFELGHAWNIGFYRFDDWPPLLSENAPYSEKLKDQRWKDKRKRILARSNNHCEECNTQAKLDVHHCYYRYGRQPWQYPDGAFLALCRNCHEKRAEAELRFRLFLPTLRTSELELIQRVLRHCQYWFPRDAVHDFMETLDKIPGNISIESSDDQVLTEDEYKKRKFSAEYRALRSKLFTMLKRADHPLNRGDDWPRNWL